MKKILLFILTSIVFTIICLSVQNTYSIFIKTVNSNITLTTTKLEATFLPGQEFNAKIKQLAGNNGAASTTQDTNITSIVRSNTLTIMPTTDNVVSTSDSPFPIYAWFSNGTLYYYTEVANPYTNQNAREMFRGLRGLTNIDISTLNTINTNSIWAMFYQDINITTIDLSNFDTRNLVIMRDIFKGCTSLQSVDLTGFNTSNVENMYGVFTNTSIEYLDISMFDMNKVTDTTGMLSGLTNLKELKTPKVYPSDTSVTLTLSKTMYDDNSVGYSVLGKSTTPTSPTKTLLKIGYVVSFNSNGGTGTMSNQIFTYDEIKKISKNTLTKPGYTFIGWTTDNTKTTYNNLITNIQATRNMTVTSGSQISDASFLVDYITSAQDTYIVFSTQTGNEVIQGEDYTLLFDVEGLTNNSNVVFGFPDSRSNLLKLKNGGNAIKFNDWYTLNFNRYVFDDKTSDSTQKFTISNFVLFKNGLTEYYDEEEISELTNNSSITLYAMWKPNKYKLLKVVSNNLIENGDIEDYTIENKVTYDVNGYTHSWDGTLNGVPGQPDKIYFVTNWGSGENRGAVVPEIGYHAHMKIVDGNAVLDFKTNEDYNGLTAADAPDGVSYTPGTITTSRWLGFYNAFNPSILTAGKKYLITFDMYRVSGNNQARVGLRYKKTNTSNYNFYSNTCDLYPTEINEWQTLTCIFTLSDDYDNQYTPQLYFYGDQGGAGEFYIDNVKLEEVEEIEKEYDSLYTNSELESLNISGYTFDGWYGKRNNLSYTSRLTNQVTFNNSNATFKNINTNGSYAIIYPKLYKLSGINLIKNGDLESYTINNKTVYNVQGYSHSWDGTLNGVPNDPDKSYFASYWGSGENRGVQVPEIGYHAHLKIVDNNAVLDYKTNEDYVGLTEADAPDGVSYTSGTITSNRWLGIAQSLDLNAIEPGETYSLKMDVYRSSGSNRVHTGLYYTLNSNSTYAFYSGSCVLIPTTSNEWQTLSCIFKVDDDFNTSNASRLYIYGHSGGTGELYVDNIVLEKATLSN